MAKFSFVVLTNPVSGLEDQFNTWYDDVHLDDVLRVRGCVSAQRFEYRDHVEPAGKWRYLAIYEWEADSVEDARQALTESRNAGEIDVDESLDTTGTGAWFFEPMSAPRVRAD
jgi:hypothetical protein